MNDKHLSQAGGEGSENYQAANNLTVHRVGLSYTEAKEVVLLLMEQNFIKFSQQALVVAKERVEEMTSAYLAGLAAKNPSLIEQVQDPGIQMALVAAQQEYVKTGDKELSDLLVDILVERTSQPKRNILQLSLTESLAIVGKLTDANINTILLNFILLHFVNKNLPNLLSLNKFCEKHIKPMIELLGNTDRDSIHIISCNCGIILPQRRSLTKEWKDNYYGLFSNGFYPEEVVAILGINLLAISTQYSDIFMQCLHNENKLQLACLGQKETFEMIVTSGIPKEKQSEIRRLARQSEMNEEQIKSYLFTYGDYMQQLMEMWDKGLISMILLNNIGLTVAVAAYNNTFKDPIEYAMWIE
jgi:hypothetical protein